MNKFEFIEKLGEGKNIKLIFIGAFGKVRLTRTIRDSGESSTDEDDGKPGSSLSRKSEKDQAATKKDESTKFFAIKILSKYQLIKAKQVDHVFNEMVLQ